MNMTALYDTAPYSLVEGDLSFRGAYYLHHRGGERQYARLKRRCTSTRLHRGISQKAAIIKVRDYFTDLIDMSVLELITVLQQLSDCWDDLKTMYLTRNN
jgi:hypothetical protein